MSKSDEFHLEEFKSLRDEIRQRIQESGVIVRNSVLASAVLVAWLATSGANIANQQLYALAWWLPLVLCGFAALRAYSLFTRIIAIGRYIQLLESVIGNAEILGWEHHLGGLRRSTWQANAIDVIAVAFWVALVVGAAVIGYLGYMANATS